MFILRFWSFIYWWFTNIIFFLFFIYLCTIFSEKSGYVCIYLKGGVPLGWFSGEGGGPDFVCWDFCDFFSPLGMILSIFLENSVKSGVFFARLTCALPPPLHWGPKSKKNQKKSNHGEWHIKWKVMTSVFDISMF